MCLSAFSPLRDSIDAHHRRRLGVLTAVTTSRPLAVLAPQSLVIGRRRSECFLRRFVVALVVALLAFLQYGYVRADSSDEWRSIGPFGISGSPYAPNLITSGPVGAIGHSASNPNMLYTGAGPFSPAGMGTMGSRGLWKSPDRGQTWNLTQSLSSSRVYAILVDLIDPNTLLAQTTSGIMKSTDGGQTWRTTYEESGYVLFHEPQSVIATTSSSILKSTDFGSTWQRMASVENFFIEAAAFLNSGQTIYLGGWRTEGSSSRVVLIRSTNGGVDFSTLQTFPEAATFNAIAITSSNPSVVWIATFESYQTTRGLYRSTDGGTSWTPTSTPDYSPQYVALDPQNLNVVYVGNDIGLYRSVDGGPFQALLRGFDVRTIDFGENNDTIFVGTDQGLFVTNDGGTTWDGLNRRANNLITSIATTSSRIIFEAQDYTRPVISCDNGSAWTTYPGACTTISGRTQESGFVVVDPYNDSWVMIYAEPVVWPGSTSALVSHDGGQTFASMSGLPNRTGYDSYRYGYSSSVIAFAAPTGQTAYFAGGAVYKTVDAGNTWSVLSDSPVNASGVAVSYQNPNLVYATNSTGLFISRDAGASWSLANLHQNGAFPDLYLPQSVQVDQGNSSVVVVGLPYCACFERSTDGGFNMTLLTTDFLTWSGTLKLYSYLLPSGRVALVMMTSNSLYASFDFGATWAQFALGLPSDSLTSFFLSARGHGYVATYGYGLWEWRNLSAAFEAAPIQGPIVSRPLGPPAPLDWIVVLGLLATAVAVVVWVVLARRRRGRGGSDSNGKA